MVWCVVRFGTTNDKVFKDAGERHNGGGFVSSAVQLFAGTETDAGIGELLAPEELRDGQHTTAETVDDVVALHGR